MADSEKGFLGYAIDGVSDSMNTDHMEGRILSCYAGGHAQRRVEPTESDNGCDTDDEIAHELLLQFGWEKRENELRDRARVLVDRHWREIVAVAMELLDAKTLDDAEVEILADIASGEAVPDDLTRVTAG